jgi:predicted small metal-binding protein
MEDTLRVRCACGWETSGSEEEVIAATGDHGLRVHNMRATREEILAMAVSGDEADDASVRVHRTED